MRRTLAALTLALAWTVSTATPAFAVTRHLHCLTTPGGTHAIAGGLTANAPQGAFDNFHFNVHQGAFVNNSPSSPVTIAGTSPTGSCD